MGIIRRNQVFVAELSCLKTLEGFCYLALVIDAYSDRVVGYDLSTSLAIGEGVQKR